MFNYILSVTTALLIATGSVSAQSDLGRGRVEGSRYFGLGSVGGGDGRIGNRYGSFGNYTGVVYGGYGSWGGAGVGWGGGYPYYGNGLGPYGFNYRNSNLATSGFAFDVDPRSLPLPRALPLPPASAVNAEPASATVTVIVPQEGQVWFNDSLNPPKSGSTWLYTSEKLEPGRKHTLNIKAQWGDRTYNIPLQVEAGDNMTMDLTKIH
jgi:hypothetical protein